MNIPNSRALYAITDCFCKVYLANNYLGCEECPLRAIKVKRYASICSFYESDYDEERLELLRACIKHGNAAMFKDLPPEYRAYVTRTVTVV